ncbi:unnamed protein product [Prorocentrum cordatum]|uniref:Solute carrier family 40 protein n=1 Tax=Prorocentrum cordatum TaxID=2364126 RepID=A0ABN9S8G0_9DINO|nr:unnamed protein product [Polarella glacialis]
MHLFDWIVAFLLDKFSNRNLAQDEPKKNHLRLLNLLTPILTLVSQILYAWDNAQHWTVLVPIMKSTTTVCTAALVFKIPLAMTLTCVFVGRWLKSGAGPRAWMRTNSSVATPVVTLSACTAPGSLEVLTCRAFGMQCFSAPMSFLDISWIRRAAFAAKVLADLPQIAATTVAAVYTGRLSQNGLLSVCFSGFSFLNTAVDLVLRGAAPPPPEEDRLQSGLESRQHSFSQAIEADDIEVVETSSEMRS